MRFRISTIALAIAASLPALASAVDFSYSGFSTAAYAQTDTDEAQVGYLGQEEGIDGDGTFAIDSKIGLQVTAKFNDMISATVQGVAYADLTADWKPHLDWAYVRLQPTSNFSARAGYLRTPTFMFSDSVFIGYANLWVRPPIEVYNLAPAYQLRGVDLLWRTSLGPVNVTVQPYYGDSEAKVGTNEYTTEVPEWGGIVVSGDYGSLTTRLGYGRMELGTTTPAIVPLITALNGVPAVACGACASEARRVDLDGEKFTLLDVGVQYDDGTNVVAGEYASRDSEHGNYVMPDVHGAYLTYGRRFGGLQPYATYAFVRRDGVQESTAIPAVGPLAALSASVNGVIGTVTNDQDSYSAGVRYEVPSFWVLNGAVVKFQYDHIDVKKGDGMLNEVQPGFDGSLNMYSLSFDFIF